MQGNIIMDTKTHTISKSTQFNNKEIATQKKIIARIFQRKKL
jgi:hypothetical protein